MRALFVDDDPISALLYAEACRLVPGWSATVAASLAEGRSALQQGPWALMVVDRHLPDGLGTDLLVEAAAAPAWRVVCSGDIFGEGQTPPAVMGADEQWPKPLDLQRLLDTLRRLHPAP